MRIVWIVGAVCISTVGLASSTRQSAEQPYSSAFKTCQDKAESTAAIKECYATELEQWDKRLNAAYQGLIKRVTAEDADSPLGSPFKPGSTRVTLLRTAERAWVAFRDADCDSRASVTGGGSGTVLEVAACRLDHTLERTQVLEALLKDQP